jgi:hypothetical protein
MKIRIDYVSNSSSSSFMVVGSEFGTDAIVEMAKLNKVKSDYHKEDGEEDNYDDWDTYELAEALEDKFPDLRFCRGIEEYYDEYCIGLGYADMKPNETKKDFEKRIKDLLKKLTGKDCKIACHVDGGREC